MKNRVIKFRAWATKAKKMVDLKKITPLALDKGVLDEGDGLFIPFREDIILMQFTGLHDKNGKEIYEGDLIEVNNDDGEEINRPKCEIKWEFGQWIAFDINAFGQWTRQLYHQSERIEIIGNIYESHDLLK